MITSYMSLNLPTPTVTLGPAWATQLNTALEVIDAHDHSSGKGIKIKPSGLDISSNLSFQSNDATNLRSVRLDNQTAALATSVDIRCLYVLNGNLYYNNNAGTSVQITDGTSVQSSSVGIANQFSALDVTGDISISGASTDSLFLINTSSARNINLPPASNVSAGRFYVLKDVSGLSNTNNISLIPSGTDTIDGVNATITFDSDFGSWIIVSNGASNWSIV